MPYRYSDQEYADMVMCYFASGHILDVARDMYQQLHRGAPIPTRTTILGAYQRLRDFGMFRPPNINAGRPRQNAFLEEELLNYFQQDPMASTSGAALRFGTTQSFSWRLLKEEGMHPYHFTRVQELLPSDYAPRIQFCRWILETPRNILWTDESTFSRVGIFNQHNTHWWASTNPHVHSANFFQHRFSVNVWAGMLNGILLGPVFLDRLNGHTYLEMFLGTYIFRKKGFGGHVGGRTLTKLP